MLCLDGFPAAPILPMHHHQHCKRIRMVDFLNAYSEPTYTKIIAAAVWVWPGLIFE